MKTLAQHKSALNTEWWSFFRFFRRLYVPRTGRWRTEVTDATDEKIFEALEDPAWDWRTVPALARAASVSEDEARGILAQYPQLVRRGRGSSGEELYTLQDRYYKRRGFFEKGWNIIRGSSSSTSTG